MISSSEDEAFESASGISQQVLQPVPPIDDSEQEPPGVLPVDDQESEPELTPPPDSSSGESEAESTVLPGRGTYNDR